MVLNVLGAISNNKRANNNQFSRNHLNKSEQTDYSLSLVICWYLISLFLINSVSVLKSVIGIPASTVSQIARAILFFLIILNMGRVYRRIKKTLILFTLFIGLLFSLNGLLLQDNDYYLPTIESFLFSIFPIVIIVMSLENMDIFEVMLIRTSRIIIVCSIIILFLARGRGGSYSMGFANSLVLPIILTLYDYYLTRKRYKLALFLIGCLVIIALGSRGALLCIGAYAIVILSRGIASKDHRIRSIVLILCIVFCLIFYQKILQTIVLLLEKMNIYSRTLFLLTFDQAHDSGRIHIYQAMIAEIQNHPLRLHGIAGEYSITNGFYAHNFVLELLCDFGIIIGGIVVLYIIWLVLKIIFGSVFYKETPVYMIFLAASIPVMLVSGTLWNMPSFWLWIGLMINKKYHFYKGEYHE